MKYRKDLEEKFKNLDFSKFLSTKSHEKSIIICPIHGEFINSFKELIKQKYGCKFCRIRVEPILKAVCEIHGEYIYKRYNSPNCKKCLIDSKTFSNKDFLKKLGKKEYTVLSNYHKSSARVLIENKYGKMLALPNHLLRGKNPGIYSAIDKTSYCINQFKEIHGNYFDYSKVIYTADDKKVTIICPIHGEFLQTPVSHRQHTCKKCAYEKLDIGFAKEDFIRISKGRICKLYLVEINQKGSVFLKIGITSRDLKTRLSSFNYTVLSLKEDLDPSYIYETEKKLHNKLKKFSFKPVSKFNGYTECYDINYLKEIIYEFRRI